MYNALVAATARARGWEQDYVGVEHILLGIIATEFPTDGGLAMMTAMGLDYRQVEKTLLYPASVPSGRAVAESIPLTPRASAILDAAAALASKDGCGVVDSAHVFRAILDERASLGSWAIAEACANSLSEIPDGLPRDLHNFVEWAMVSHGAVWAIVGNAWPEVLAAFKSCGRLSAPPELERETQILTLHGFLSEARITIFANASGAHLHVNPGEKRRLAWETRNFDLAARVSCRLKAIVGVKRIPRPIGLTSTALRISSSAGQLDHSFFAGRAPVGSLETWNHSQIKEAHELYQSLAKSGHIPTGDYPIYQACLLSPDSITLAINMEGNLVGTGTIMVKEFNPCLPLMMDLGFGLIAAEYHRKGLGRTLLAARLWIACHLNCHIVDLLALPGSLPWLTSIGFRFAPGTIDTLHFGRLALGEPDKEFLESWLGPDMTSALSICASRMRKRLIIDN